MDADRARPAQALVNLLNNATKYTERGGRITVSTREEQRKAVISGA